jgi:TRAP-type mannitol/chloroaromatic compound transport system permease small subunit
LPPLGGNYCIATAIHFKQIKEKTMHAIIRLLEAITRSIGFVSAWIIVPLAGSMVWEVVSRYVFSKPTIWAYEAAYMQMGALFVLGIAFVSQMDGHVRVDLVYANFSTRKKALADLIGLLLIAPLVFWLCFGLWEYFERAWSSGERSGESIWSPVVWPSRATFWLGFVLFAMQITAEVLKSLSTLFTGQSYYKEA